MTGVVMAGRTGAAFAAQLGTMQVNEEIDALKTLGISPMDFLVLPRMLALVLMMPLLTVYTNVIGVVGGAIVANTQLGVSFVTYFEWATRYTKNKGLYIGLFKSVLFAVIIATVACHQGFSVSEGAVGVGHATRRTVIVSFLSILIPGELFAPAYRRHGLAAKNLSRTTEDSGTVVVPLIPWSIAGVFMAGTLGVDTLAYAGWAIMCYLGFVFALCYGFTGFAIAPRIHDDETVPGS